MIDTGCASIKAGGERFRLERFVCNIYIHKHTLAQEEG